MFKAIQKIHTPRQPRSIAQGLAAHDKEEHGSWHYLVLDPNGIRPRTEASYDKETGKEKSRYHEATVVQVSKRWRSGWTTWLACENGWVFDISPKDKRVRMVEVEMCRGDWQYQVCNESVPLLSRPSSTLATSARLHRDEVVSVKEKVRPIGGKGGFLHLADGGWVAEMASGHQAMRRSDADAALDADPASDSPSSSERTRSLGATSGSECSVEDAELGEWTYIVLDPKGITLRQSATDSKDMKLSRRIAEGELVTVVERRSGDGTTYLRLEAACGGGWAFDVGRGRAGGRKARMLEVSLELGRWDYRVCSEKGIAVRSLCSLADGCRVGTGPQRGALISVSRRVLIGGVTFLHLEEGGWIFDRNKSGTLLVQGPLAVESVAKTAAVKNIESVCLRSSPTQERWAETKMLVLLESFVQVDRIGLFDGLRWAHISKSGGGMNGWVLAGGLDFKAALPIGPGSSMSKPFSAEQVRAAWFAPDPTCPTPRTVVATCRR